MASLSGAGRPTLRRDAELNRRRIIAVAHEVFRDLVAGDSLGDLFVRRQRGTAGPSNASGRRVPFELGRKRVRK
jgi:hypothetical protein